MISTKEKSIITKLASRYHAKHVYLFGSHTRRMGRKPRDIDLGVDGIAPSRFFLFYTELYDRLSQPVDLVDLKSDTLFCRLVKKEGILIYG